MKTLLLIIICIFPVIMQGAPPASVSLHECHDAALKHFPLVRQAGLIAQTEEYSVDNVYRGYYPQVSVIGHAWYQSDVTKVPARIPGLAFEPLSKDQYRAQIEVVQTIWDGGAMGSQSDLASTQAAVSKNLLEVELYRLKERVNQLYFGIMLLQEQIEQVQLLRNDLEAARTSVAGAVAAGAAQKRDMKLLEAEVLTVQQRQARLRASRVSYVQVLAYLTGLELDTTTILTSPDETSLQDDIVRPELRLFEAQRRITEVRSDAITARYLPKFQAYFHGGYGRPGLDMLVNEFTTFYVTGIRMSWPLTDLYTSGNERSLLDVNRQEVDVQQETFLFNTRMTMTQQRADLVVYDDLLKLDVEILDRRKEVRDIATEQLANGTITAHDYLRDANALDIARHERSLHSIQRMMAMESYRITTGN